MLHTVDTWSIEMANVWRTPTFSGSFGGLIYLVLPWGMIWYDWPWTLRYGSLLDLYWPAGVMKLYSLHSAYRANKFQDLLHTSNGVCGKQELCKLRRISDQADICGNKPWRCYICGNKPRTAYSLTTYNLRHASIDFAEAEMMQPACKANTIAGNSVSDSQVCFYHCGASEWVSLRIWDLTRQMGPDTLAPFSGFTYKGSCI